MFLTFRYRLLPTRGQHRALRAILEGQRQLYNAALEERKGAWDKSRKSINYQAQFKSLTIIRQDPEYSHIPITIQRGTILRLERAFNSFFKRVKKGEKPGYPRFKGKDRFRSFQFSEFSGIRLKQKRLYFKGVTGGIRVHFHRPIPINADIRTAIFVQDTKGWKVCLGVDSPTPEKKELSSDSPIVGVDVGISTLFALSGADPIPNPRIARKTEKLLRVRQRALSRCRRGSNRRVKVKAALVKLHVKTTNRRRTYLHQATASIIRRYDMVAVENLNVKGLSRSNLAKPVHDAAWGIAFSMLSYKAERAGVTFIKVNPRHTSQNCSGCGSYQPKDLSVRIHECSECGLILDRDQNAARNILHKAVVGLGLVNVVQWGERRAGNIGLCS
jgi:putative transposase